LFFNAPLIYSKYENKAALIIHPNEVNMWQTHEHTSPFTKSVVDKCR